MQQNIHTTRKILFLCVNDQSIFLSFLNISDRDVKMKKEIVDWLMNVKCLLQLKVGASVEFIRWQFISNFTLLVAQKWGCCGLTRSWKYLQHLFLNTQYYHKCLYCKYDCAFNVPFHPPPPPHISWFLWASFTSNFVASASSCCFTQVSIHLVCSWLHHLPCMRMGG